MSWEIFRFPRTTLLGGISYTIKIWLKADKNQSGKGFYRYCCPYKRREGISSAGTALFILNLGTTVQFPYLEPCGERKWRKTKGDGGAWYEDSSCFMAGDISEKYQPQIHRPLQLRCRHSDCNVSDKFFWTGGICWVIYTGQADTYPTLPAFLKCFPSVKIRELDCRCRGVITSRTCLFILEKESPLHNE
jgi:hypothetical protein